MLIGGQSMVKVTDYSNSKLGKVEIAPEVLSVIASIATSKSKASLAILLN